MESDIRWGLKDPELGEEAQTRGRPARDRGLPLPKTGEDRVVAREADTGYRLFIYYTGRDDG